MIIKRVCPFCGCNAKKTVFHRDYSGMADIVPFSSYDVCMCDKCGGVIADNIEQKRSLEEYYDRMSKYENDSYTVNKNSLTRYSYIAHLLKDHADLDSEIIDIGAARGNLLDELRKIGFKKLTGLEPSSKNVEYGKNQLNLDMYVGALPDDLKEIYKESAKSGASKMRALKDF